MLRFNKARAYGFIVETSEDMVENSIIVIFEKGDFKFAQSIEKRLLAGNTKILEEALTDLAIVKHQDYVKELRACKK